MVFSQSDVGRNPIGDRADTKRPDLTTDTTDFYSTHRPDFADTQATLQKN